MIGTYANEEHTKEESRTSISELKEHYGEY